MGNGVLNFYGNALGALGTAHTLDVQSRGVSLIPPPVSGVAPAGCRSDTDPTTPTRTDFYVDRNIIAGGGYRTQVGTFAYKTSSLLGSSVSTQMCLPGTTTAMYFSSPFAGCIVGLSFWCSTYAPSLTGGAVTATVWPEVNAAPPTAVTTTGASGNFSGTLALSSGTKVVKTAPYGGYPFNAGDNITIMLSLSASVTSLDTHAHLIIHH